MRTFSVDVSLGDEVQFLDVEVLTDIFGFLLLPLIFEFILFKAVQVALLSFNS